MPVSVMFFNSMDMNQWKNILLITLTVWVAGVSCEVKDPDIPQANLSVSETSVVTDFEYAVLNGRASCNFTIQDLFLEYSTDPNLSSATKVHSENSGGDFHIVLNGLGIQTTYYYRYSVSNKFGTLVDNQIRQFKTHDYTEPEVQTLAASSIQGTKAVLEGRVNYSCGKAILNKGFLFGRKGEEMKPLPVTEEDFKLALTNLEMGTEYTFQAFAESEIGTGYGNTLSFTTYPPVSFLTTEVSEITATSALVKGGVLSDGGVPILEQGFCYQAGSDAVISIPYYTSTTLTNLTPDTIYTVWYYALTDDGEFKSDPVTFTTPIPISFSPVTVSSIKTTMAVVQGGITSVSDDTIIEQGIGYQEVSSGTSATVFYAESARITGLKASTEYSVWYYAKTPHGEYRSDACTFTTASERPDYVLDGIFSVATDKKVSFSRGLVRSNEGLRLITAYQYNIVGNQNTYDNQLRDIIDMFLSTSGMGAISGITWDHLSIQEWKYLLEERPHAKDLYYSNITVQGVAGSILLPDNWDKTILSFESGTSLDNKLFLYAQDLGAVFLPYSGYLNERTNAVTTHLGMQDVGTCTVLLPGIQIGINGIDYNFQMSSSGEKSYVSIYGAVRLVKVRKDL